MGVNLFSKLRANQEFFSNVERRIANLILSDPHEFITYSMPALASAAQVSQGSINNFARKFSDGGFAELKLRIAKDLAEYDAPAPLSLVKEDDSIKDVYRRAVDGVVNTFNNTAKMNDEQTLQNVVDLILKAKRIEIYGLYYSGVVAVNLQYQLLRLGIPASHVNDVLMYSVSAAMLDKDCLVIAISSSGQTKDVLDAVDIAKENNVPVVCMTANAYSTLAKKSDEVLVAASAGESIIGSAEEARLAQMLFIDSICAYIQFKTDETGNKHYFKTKEILNSHSIKD